MVTSDKYLATIKNDPELREMISLLLEWFFKDSFIHSGGIIISSRPGTGKTTIAKCIHNLKYYYNPTDHDIIGHFEYRSFDTDLNNFKNNHDIDLSYSDHCNIIIDDINTDISLLKKYGNEYSLNDIFKARYELWKNHNFKTIILTNIPVDTDGKFKEAIKASGVHDLLSLVSPKVADRIKEQYHSITLKSPSRR